MKRSLFLVAAFITYGMLSAQTKIGNVTLPNTLKTSTSTLYLNGGGIREKYWMNMYVGGLYVEKKTTDAEAIIKADAPMAITLHIVSGLITSSRMSEAVEEGFLKSTKNNTSSLKDRIETFKAVFEKEEIKINDVYNIVYLPGTGVVILKNKLKQATIKGLDFKRALWGIWLCDDPADDDLKEGMLGK